jgi:predicted Zn-dependent peptidase
MSAIPLPALPAADTFLLPGGCPVWVLRRPGPAILSIKLWIRGGSAEDPPGQRGRAQLLAGLLSRGCADLSGEALADLVEGLGDELRAEATEDALLISLKGAGDDAAALLPLLPAMVRAPWLAPDQLSLERGLNLQTLHRQREDPFQQAHDGLRRQLYGLGPYGHDPLGEVDDLRSLERPRLLEAAGGLGGSGTVLVIAGQPPADLPRILEEAWAAHPWRTHAPEPAPGPAGEGPPALVVQEQDTEQLVLMLGAATVPLGDPRSLALRLLQCHLGVGMSSRLFVALREEHGLAYDVGVHLPARRGAAPFVFHLSSSAERAGEATTELLGEWQRLLDQPLSSAEWELALAKFRGLAASGRQTCGQIADRQALVLGHGLPWSYADDALREAAEWEPRRLLQTARELLARPSLSLCGPSAALKAAEAAWRAHPLGLSCSAVAVS